MRTRYRTLALAALLPLVFAGVGCNLVKAKAAFKDGNARYKDENYRKAIEDYEKAVALKPNFAEAHFYLASSHQNLYRPGKPGDENRTHLDTAIEHFEKSLEVNTANTPERKQLRLNTLGALDGDLLRPAAPELREGPGLRGADRQGRPERHEEPLRDGRPVREVQSRRRGRGDLQEGDRAEPERRQGLRHARGLLQQAALGRAGRRLRRGSEQGLADARSSTSPSPRSRSARRWPRTIRAATRRWRPSTGTRPTATRT